MNIEKTGNHVDSLFSQTRMHHVRLSAMADIKANILLTVSSVMLSFSLPYLTTPIVQWPAISMMSFCGLTALSSIMALIPKLPSGQRRKKDDPGFNLLFFGSFADLTYEEFHDEIEKVCNDHNKVYEAQVKEIYYLGVYLARKKYYYLRQGYKLFLAGLMVSALLLVGLELLAQAGMKIWVLQLGMQ